MTDQPNTQPDRTGITQPLDEIIAALQAASPEVRKKMLDRIDAKTDKTHQDLAATVAPTPPQAKPITTEPPSPSEQQILSLEQLLDTTSAQYDAAYQNWKATFELPQRYFDNLAKKDVVMAWVKTVPKETIRAILKYGKPRLKLLTEMPVPNLLEVLNQHPTIPEQKDSVIWWDQWRTIAAKPGTFGLTPDIEDMPQESIHQSLRNPAIIAEYKRRFQQTPFSTSMPQAAYLPSAMDELARGQIYDRKYWTGFEQPLGAVLVPLAYWYDDHVFLRGNDPDGSDAGLRGRLWVPGEKFSI